MDSNERDYLKLELGNLLHATAGCKPTMHEPDEEGVTGKTTGVILDNAGSHGELTLQLERDEEVFTFNIATLVALARLAVIEDDDVYTGPIAEQHIEGQRIESVCRASDALLQAEGWAIEQGVSRPIVFVLTNGTALYAANNEEGDRPGVMTGRTPDGEGFMIV